MLKKFFIKTFGCQQNVADSERLASYYRSRGFVPATNTDEADLVVINSCMVREQAEERVYGFIRNLRNPNRKAGKIAKGRGVDELRIVLTGCIVGAAAREPSGAMARKLAKRIPDVELLPMEDVGFEYIAERPKGEKHAWVVISNGCNNFCAFCIVPFARGREVSRPMDEVLAEVRKLAAEGYNSITLLGQNVNSYGADLVLKTKEIAQNKQVEKNAQIAQNEKVGSGNSDNADEQAKYTLPDGREVAPVWVEYLGRTRIPTLFPYLLEQVAQISGIDKVTFTSSNPWDFSDELIDVIAQNSNIDRLLHLPVQSGSDKILKSMNRWYTAEQYLQLLERIRTKIPEVQFMTDIIVGFPGETDEDFAQTVELAKRAKFVKSFIAQYSPRPGTHATRDLPDNVPQPTKKRRFEILNEQINIPNKTISHSQDWIRTSGK